MENSLPVSKAKLISLLGLVESTGADIPAEDGRQHYYVRFFEFTVGELRAMVEMWDLEVDFQPPEATVWVDLVEGMKADRVVNLLYVGTCAAPLTPYDRLEKDRKRTHSLYGALNEVLAGRDGQMQGRCYHVPSAQLPAEATQQLKDLNERILVALFGLPLLLNQQVGGFLASYQPGQDLQALWKRSQSRFLQLLLKLVEPPSMESVNRHCSWADDELAKLEEHPEGTGHDKCPTTLPRLMSMLRQSLPLQLRGGHTLWVILGKDITLQNYLHADGFFQSGCRAAELLLGLLESCQEWSSPDEQRSILQLHSQKQLRQFTPAAGPPGGDPPPGVPIEGQLLPFGDMWCTLRHFLFWLILLILLGYLKAAKPLIINTTSQEVAAVAASNFSHQHGIKKEGFLRDTVGGMELVNFAGDEHSPEVDDCWAIVIYHMHSGHDKYDSQPPELRDLLLITWMSAIRVAELLLDLLDKGRPKETRKELLLATLQAAEKDRTCQELKQRLAAAKEEYQRCLKLRYNQRPPPGGGFTSEAARGYNVLRCQADLLFEGPVQSEERKAFVCSMLWERDCRIMVNWKAEPGEVDVDWWDWAMNVEPGTNVRMAAMARAHLAKYPPDGLERMEQMASARVKALAARTDEWLVMLHGEHVAYLRHQEGRKVVVASDGRTYLRWLRAPGDKVAETVCFPGSLVASERVANRQDASVQEAHLHVHFLPEGISLSRHGDATDPLQLDLGARVIKPVSKLNANLMEMLKHELEAKGLEVVQNGRPIRSAKVGERVEGIEWEVPQPIEKEDGAWLLQQFLAGFLPPLQQTPGRMCYVYTNAPDDVRIPEAYVHRSLSARFKEFLGNPENVGKNGHAQAWLDELESGTGQQTLKNYLQFFYGPISFQSKQFTPTAEQKRLGAEWKTKKIQIFWVGPARDISSGRVTLTKVELAPEAQKIKPKEQADIFRS